jgi:flagellar basal-body rod protein FlgG
VVQLADGSEAYTRDGTFKRDSNGQVVSSAGNVLSPAIDIPPDAIQITISQDGNVSITNPDGTTQTIGQIQIARFQNPGGLRAKGGNLFQESAASGASELGTAGENGFGLIAQGYIENSNVQIVEEMVNLIIAQRAFESNSKAVQAADEMLNVINSLKR